MQALRFKLKILNPTCRSSKSIKQLTDTIFVESAIFVEKKRVENRLWAKSEFWGQKKMHHLHPFLSPPPTGPALPHQAALPHRSRLAAARAAAARSALPLPTPARLRQFSHDLHCSSATQDTSPPPYVLGPAEVRQSLPRPVCSVRGNFPSFNQSILCSHWTWTSISLATTSRPCYPGSPSASAANRWSTNGEPGQETRITVPYLQRERERGQRRRGSGQRGRGSGQRMKKWAKNAFCQQKVNFHYSVAWMPVFDPDKSNMPNQGYESDPSRASRLYHDCWRLLLMLLSQTLRTLTKWCMATNHFPKEALPGCQQVWNMQRICKNYAKNMQKTCWICKNYANIMPKLFKRSAKICKKYVKHIHNMLINMQICNNMQQIFKNMLKIKKYAQHPQNMPQICVKYQFKQICKKYAEGQTNLNM